MEEIKFIEVIRNKKVLFITTKNLDYIRNTQELKILNENAQSVDIVSSNVKKYIFRIPDIWKQISKKKVNVYDVIFVGFEPQFIIPYVGFKFKNKTLIIDFFISVYDTLACDRKKIRKNGILAQYCHYIDKRTLNRADYVITDTDAHARYFIEEFQGNKERFETLYLEADSNIYYPRPQNKPDKLKNKFVVLYFGSILPLQGIEVILNAIKELKKEEDVFFDIIGPISQKYNKPIQGNVNYTEWLSQEDLAQRIANADLCLAGHFNANIRKADRTIPGKAYIYELMDKTMILGEGVANHELFVADQRHFWVEMGNYKDLADEILKIKEKHFDGGIDET